MVEKKHARKPNFSLQEVEKLVDLVEVNYKYSVPNFPMYSH
jgi:hypothetical protein